MCARGEWRTPGETVQRGNANDFELAHVGIAPLRPYTMSRDTPITLSAANRFLVQLTNPRANRNNAQLIFTFLDVWDYFKYSDTKISNKNIFTKTKPPLFRGKKKKKIMQM